MPHKRNTLVEFSIDDARYLAGLFYGEGCIQILPHYRTRSDKKQSMWYLRIDICNTHEGVLRWCKERFGGGVLATKSYRANNARRFIWQMYGHEALHILKGILPFLIIKKPQAVVAIEFQELVASVDAGARKRGMARGPILTDDEILQRKDMSLKLKAIRAADKQINLDSIQ